MNNKTLLSVFVAAFVLTGCGAESYTVDYLYKNEDIRFQVLEDCAKNKQTSDNCKNANEAEAKLKGESWASKRNR